MKNKVAVIIPALNPDKALIQYCEVLLGAGIDFILVVNDGSDREYKDIFDAIGQKHGCCVITHRENQGKGRALKDAFRYFMEKGEFTEQYIGVITVDSDGQHSAEDVIKLKRELCQNRKELILGVRDFQLSHVPAKSRYGNKLTCFIFYLLHGVKLKDTQTGLRAIPCSILPCYVNLKGERFEYETNMLIATADCGIPFCEIEIQTIYLNQNEGTHFRPFRDSVIIYGLLFQKFIRYVFSGLSSFLLDILAFRLILTISHFSDAAVRITFSTVCARILSSIYNFMMNRNFVFEKKGKIIEKMIPYYLLCFFQTCASAFLVFVCYQGFDISETVAKIVVDMMLFIISYQIQKRCIFNN